MKRYFKPRRIKKSYHSWGRPPLMPIEKKKTKRSKVKNKIKEFFKKF